MQVEVRNSFATVWAIVDDDPKTVFSITFLASDFSNF